MDVGEFFAKFIEKWPEDKYYDLGYFSTHYCIKYNVAQYYLRKAVYDGRLCCVKIRNKSYYMLPKWEEQWKKLKLDYVKVL